MHVIDTGIVVVIQSTAQASLTSHNNVLIITSWRWRGLLPCGLAQIINCSVLIFSGASCSEGVCVFPSWGADPGVGYYSSRNRALHWDCQLFSSGLILPSAPYYYRNSIMSSDLADCWTLPPIKAQHKTVQPQTHLSRNPVWHGWEPWVLLGDAILKGEPCNSLCRCKAELIVSLMRHHLTCPL